MTLFDDPDKLNELVGLRRRIDLIQKTLATAVADLALVTESLQTLEGDIEVKPKAKPTASILHLPRALCQKFDDEFRKKFNNEPAPIDWPKDTAIMKRLAATRSPERLHALIETFFASPDPFICNSGYTIGTFSSQIGKLIVSTNGNGSQNIRGVTPQTSENIRNSPVAREMIRRTLERR